MSAIFWLIGAGVAVAAASQLFKMWKSQELPDLSDADFLDIYEEEFGGQPDQVLEQRRYVARYLGLPYQKLAPSHRFTQLSRFTGFVTEYEVGMGDLEDELWELYQGAGLERPPAFPETVAQLIEERLKALRVKAS
jgi:hypothetical protein